MILFLSIVVLILAGAIVMVFAMLGELSSRVPASNEESLRRIEAIDTARTGHSPSHWPAELAHVAEQEYSLVLILSSTCVSCEKIAGQVSKMLDRGPANLGLVVACPARERGEHFAATHGIDRGTLYIDEDGAWTKGEFSVETSPAALLFRNGRLQSALLFWDLPAVLTAVGSMSANDQEVA
ncbi:hypothetical protein [Plantactinospora soyae]|uniref:Thioredoxin domain-containing protein n=1 Tax=Plantactinospora soyae TaxID=1544732 RepID=A0A927MDL6_9ACTN|nr:hypothetical protein [Plantactinospora soyae]MBE1492783.1 hypothetical protein [Plantactinospora soyae]